MLACARGYTADVGCLGALQLLAQASAVPIKACMQPCWNAMQTKKLLEMGADVAARDKKGVTPLHFAAGQGRLEIVQFLWSKAAELEAEDPGDNCISFACISRC